MTMSFQVLSEFPKQCGVECLYTVLSSAVFVRNHLVHYEDVLGSEPRYVYSLSHKKSGQILKYRLCDTINRFSDIL